MAWISAWCASNLRLIGRVLGAVAQRPDQCVVAVGFKLGADAQQRRDQRGLGHAAPMIVHAIPNPRHTGRIGTWLAVQQDRAAAWKNKPIPGEQHAALARRDFAVIFADQPRALRDEKNASRRAVIDRKSVV